MKCLNIVIVGVGGQGTLLTSKILAQLAKAQGYNVKVSEVHGMAQRGGSVITHVRIGAQVHAPLVAAGSADYLLAFEPLEAARAVSYLQPDGKLIVSTQRIPPMPVLSGTATYPEEPYQALLCASQAVEALDAYAIAVEAGSYRAVNLVLLGVLSRHMEFPEEAWIDAIAACVPTHTLETNRKAFMAGRKK
ncbi:MAG: indolepyruvate oxidoreductase subunit beta [Clostridiales bacterium]|nr:indolepyruvate oxidoreductase subunit beta [Clostridiales bacterium]